MSTARFVTLCGLAGVVIGSVMTHPLVLAPTTTVIDDGTFDAFQFTWNLWWMRESLFTLHRNPFHTTYLFYPDGVGLLFHTFSSPFGMLSLPLQLVLPGGALTANNVLVFLSPALTLIAVGLLARDVTDDAWAGLAGGLAAAVNAVAVWFLPVIYLHCGYLIAFALWTWGRLHRTTHVRWAIATLTLSWVLVFASAEYGLMVLALLVLDTLTRAAFAQRLGLPRLWWPGALGFWAATAVGVVWLGVLAGADPAEPPPMHQLLWGSAYILGFFAPPWAMPAPTQFWTILFLGTVPLLLAPYAVIVDRDRMGYWLLTLVVCLLMACGPYLNLVHPLGLDMDGTPESIEAGGLYGPYALAYQLVPLLRFFRAPYRWLVPAQIVLGVLVAGGLAGLRTRLPRPRSRAFVTGVVLAALPLVGALDARGLRADIRDARVPAVYDILRDDPEPAAVLELPSGIGPGFSLRSSLYMYYQTHHRKFLLEGTVSRLPAGHQPVVYRRIDDFAAMPYVKWVVIHRDLLEHSLPESREQVTGIEGLLAEHGEQVAASDQIEVYRLRTFRPETVR